MAPRGPRPALLLPLLLLAAVPALATGPACVGRNRRFVRHHVDYPWRPVPDPSACCNAMMQNQGTYGKRLNTFIHAPVPTISNVCFGGGIPLAGSLRRSKAVFPVTRCRFDPLRHVYTGTQASQTIDVRCCQGLPALLVGQTWVPSPPEHYTPPVPAGQHSSPAPAPPSAAP